jgi:hypothetical protein
MGGRAARTERRQSESSYWIREVPTPRLKAYQRVLSSGGKGVRIDGGARSVEAQSYFSGLLSSELSRRGE